MLFFLIFSIELDQRSACLNTSSRLSEALREVGAIFWDPRDERGRSIIRFAEICMGGWGGVVLIRGCWRLGPDEAPPLNLHLPLSAVPVTTLSAG